MTHNHVKPLGRSKKAHRYVFRQTVRNSLFSLLETLRKLELDERSQRIRPWIKSIESIIDDIPVPPFHKESSVPKHVVQRAKRESKFRECVKRGHGKQSPAARR